jgi:hypothetical protein
MIVPSFVPKNNNNNTMIVTLYAQLTLELIYFSYTYMYFLSPIAKFSGSVTARNINIMNISAIVKPLSGLLMYFHIERVHLLQAYNFMYLLIHFIKGYCCAEWRLQICLIVLLWETTFWLFKKVFEQKTCPLSRFNTLLLQFIWHNVLEYIKNIFQKNIDLYFWK